VKGFSTGTSACWKSLLLRVTSVQACALAGRGEEGVDGRRRMCWALPSPLLGDLHGDWNQALPELLDDLVQPTAEGGRLPVINPGAAASV
jgi:hypothetical protein